MKTLNRYITEWKFNKEDTSSNINYNSITLYFFVEFPVHLRVFSERWTKTEYFKHIKNNVYEGDTKIDIFNNGLTNQLINTGIHILTIKDISSMTSFDYMFQGCDRLERAIIYNSSNIKSMVQMFYDSKGLEHIYIDNMMSVVDTTRMFSQDTRLKHVVLHNLKNIRNTTAMFADCESLEKYELTNIGNKLEDTTTMFGGCISLREVPLFNMDNVIHMTHMFHTCNKLSEKTKKEWSHIYDFEKNNKKK